MRSSTVTGNKEKKPQKKDSILIEKLYASELHYRCLFESTKDGILILDAETGKIVDVNPFLIDLLGYTKQIFIEKSIWEIGVFQDIYENKEKFLELQQKEYVRYDDLPLVTSDGRKIHVECVSNVYLVNDNKVIQCQIRDITARKETEAAFEKTRKELAEIKKSADELNIFTENVIDTLREPLLAMDKDLRVIKASASFYKFFKVTTEETIGKLIYELGNYQWNIPKLKELLEKIIPEKNSFDNYEVEHNFSAIGRRVMLLNARQVKRAFGKEQIILLAIEDITERKGKEDSLKKTHRATSDFLNNLLDHMHAPIIIWDTSMIIKRFNRQFELLSGYGSADVIDKKMDFLFPEEKIAATLELLKNHLDDKLEAVEIDILTKDNNIKTVLWNSSRILDEEGKNIIATISQDITSRKRTEDALTLLETRYRRLFESAKDGILILDAETGKIVDVNPFLIDLLGYSKYEFIEKSIWEIGSFKDIYENKEKFFELQQKEYVRYDDLPLVTSDGNEIHVEFVSNVYLCNNIKVIQCNIRDITESTNIRNEIKFQADLINNVGQAVIATDLQGKVIYWNNAAEKIYGWSTSEATGQNIMHLTPAQQSNEQAIDIMQKLGAGKTWAGEFQVKRKDGSSFPAFVTDTPILDSNGKLTGIIGISSDITESKQIHQLIKENEEKFETITENSADAIFITDMEGKYIYVNKQAVDLLGYSKEEFLTYTIADISPKNKIEEYSKIFQKLFITGSSYSEIELVKKDGSYAETDLNAVLLPNGWVYGSCRDISKRKQLENELIEAKEKAEESDRLKTAFLHNISHEIRTPLNAIVGFSGFLNNPELIPEKRKNYTNIIIQSSEQLLAIIDDIISIASIETGQEKIQENEININVIGKLIKEQFSLKANDKNVILSLNTILADDEALIITDTTKILQILTNLVGNALKFTQQGYVNFGYEVKDNQLEFYVEDSGMGIPLDMQEVIFNRFRQVETTDTRHFGGSGLGLSISKAYVEMLGGKMWLSSEPGKGSEFYFTIPYRNANPKKMPDTPAVDALNFKFNTTKTVLIAEDEDSNFTLLEEMFSDYGLNIIRAENGLEAVRLCKSNPLIDLVLMDLKMPVMDGFEATMRIKEFKPDVPIIAQTAYISLADRNKALACGCSDYISKPINKELLLFKIHEQLLSSNN
ncbi:MAG: PAS domain S-box protein [Bacteroidales bacterium]